MDTDQLVDDRADISAPRSTKFGAIVVVLLLHVAVIFGLIRAFAPGAISASVEKVVSVFSVTVTTPPPSPPPPAKSPDAVGAAGAAGKKAIPKAIAAPKPKVSISKTAAPKTPGTGSAVTSGTRDTGQGSGAGGTGTGPGSGTGGTGQGGGTPTKLEKIGGDINSVRDFPRGSRDERVGKEVIVEFDVGRDGRATACRVVAPSGMPEADAIVCRLGVDRFRFKPRTDGSGNPQPGKYRWRQRWWDPRD